MRSHISFASLTHNYTVTEFHTYVIGFAKTLY